MEPRTPHHKRQMKKLFDKTEEEKVQEARSSAYKQRLTCKRKGKKGSSFCILEHRSNCQRQKCRRSALCRETRWRGLDTLIGL